MAKSMLLQLYTGNSLTVTYFSVFHICCYISPRAWVSEGTHTHSLVRIQTYARLLENLQWAAMFSVVSETHLQPGVSPFISGLREIVGDVPFPIWECTFSNRLCAPLLIIHSSKRESWEYRVKLKADVISPYWLTSLLIQHDQSSDAGIFTLTKHTQKDKKGQGRAEEWEKKRVNATDQSRSTEQSGAVRTAEVGQITTWNHFLGVADLIWHSGNRISFHTWPKNEAKSWK